MLAVINDVEGCENDNALKQLERGINSAHSLFISICEHANKHLPTPKENVPHNKNIEPQKRFFSTKKKTRKNNIRLAKPYKEEQIKIRRNWQGHNDQTSNDMHTSSVNINTEGGYILLSEMVSTVEFGHDSSCASY